MPTMATKMVRKRAAAFSPLETAAVVSVGVVVVLSDCFCEDAGGKGCFSCCCLICFREDMRSGSLEDERVLNS
mgnify:CR=1 FL=1